MLSIVNKTLFNDVRTEFVTQPSVDLFQHLVIGSIISLLGRSGRVGGSTDRKLSSREVVEPRRIDRDLGVTQAIEAS